MNNNNSQNRKEIVKLTNEKENLSKLNKDYILKIANLTKEIDSLKINNNTTKETYEKNINDLNSTIDNHKQLNITLNNTLKSKENENNFFKENIKN